jgi:radical SAM protein with 4Fe4S-binding SPASM domain
MKRKKGYMDEGLFRNIIDQCVRYKIPQVLLMGFGEPLMDKDYIRKVSYAKQKGVEQVFCITNAILLNEAVAEGMIDSGLDFLSISIDAATADAYEQIHLQPDGRSPSDKFQVVVDNIDRLLSLKKQRKSKKPYVQVRFKDFDKNKGEVGRFIRKYRKNADEVIIYMNIINWPGSSIKNNLPPKSLLRFPCFNLWASLFVTYDGEVALCCQDYDCRVTLGNMRNGDLMALWKGDKLRTIRQMHLKGEYDRISICKECVINSHYLNPWWM